MTVMPYIQLAMERRYILGFTTSKNLHSASYWLNPSFLFNTGEFEKHKQTTSGLLDVIERHAYGDADLIYKLASEMKIFKNAEQDFERQFAICERTTVMPVLQVVSVWCTNPHTPYSCTSKCTGSSKLELLCLSKLTLVLLSSLVVSDFFYGKLYVINAMGRGHQSPLLQIKRHWPWLFNLMEGEALAVHSLGDPTQNATDKVKSSRSENAVSLGSSLYHKDLNLP
ncbi:hypothetical protein AHAS_Ahas05G0060600 [Arachis hypogaea]